MDTSIQLRGAPPPQPETAPSAYSAKAWNEGMTFTGVYHNVKYYTDGAGNIHALFGWKPTMFGSLAKFQYAVRRWESEDD